MFAALSHFLFLSLSPPDWCSRVGAGPHHECETTTHSRNVAADMKTSGLNLQNPSGAKQHQNESSELEDNYTSYLHFLSSLKSSSAPPA